MQYKTSILNEREIIHGDYKDSSRIAVLLKGIIRIECNKRRSRNQPVLSYEQLTSLEMIAHKIGRIIAGDPNEPEHWDDISGYAKLISECIHYRPFDPKPAPDMSHMQIPTTKHDHPSYKQVDVPDSVLSTLNNELELDNG